MSATMKMNLRTILVSVIDAIVILFIHCGGNPNYLVTENCKLPTQIIQLCSLKQMPLYCIMTDAAICSVVSVQDRVPLRRQHGKWWQSLLHSTQLHIKKDSVSSVYWNPLTHSHFVAQKLFKILSCPMGLYITSLSSYTTKPKQTNYDFDICKSVHHHTIQINQPTRCNSLLLNIHMWLDMFRASHRPSSGPYNCTRSLWFYLWKETAGALLVMIWLARPQPTTIQSFPSKGRTRGS
jgi:hypothetical protein